MIVRYFHGTHECQKKAFYFFKEKTGVSQSNSFAKRFLDCNHKHGHITHHGGKGNKNVPVSSRLPYEFCVYYVMHCLAVASTESTQWLLTLFEGVGSFGVPCANQGVWLVRVYDRNGEGSWLDKVNKVLHVDMFIDSKFDMQHLLSLVSCLLRYECN